MCVNGNTANEHVMQNQGTGLDASIPKVKFIIITKPFTFIKFMYSYLIALKMYVYVVFL